MHHSVKTLFKSAIILGCRYSGTSNDHICGLINKNQTIVRQIPIKYGHMALLLTFKSTVGNQLGMMYEKYQINISSQN